jgi:class 3 adenylate cyclase
VGDDLPMSASAPEMVAVLMADLVGSTAMADRVVG